MTYIDIEYVFGELIKHLFIMSCKGQFTYNVFSKCGLDVILTSLQKIHHENMLLDALC